MTKVHLGELRKLPAMPERWLSLQVIRFCGFDVPWKSDDGTRLATWRVLWLSQCFSIFSNRDPICQSEMFKDTLHSLLSEGMMLFHF